MAENGTILERLSIVGNGEQNGNGKLSKSRKRKRNGKLSEPRLGNGNETLSKDFGNVSTTVCAQIKSVSFLLGYFLNYSDSILQCT